MLPQVRFELIVSAGNVDTIVVGGMPVRLDGVDGPELDTLTGPEAKAFTQRLLAHPWSGMCVCFIDAGDIGATAIAEQHALNY